jgi:hypothetical protein
VRAAFGEGEGEITGAAREVERALSGTWRGKIHHPCFPPAVQAERKQDGDEVVAVRDRREKLPDVSGF